MSYEICYCKHPSKRIIDKREVITYKDEFVSANILSVEVGTNTPMGGDGGHGGRTYLRIMDESCTNIEVKRLEDKYDRVGVEIILGGDCEPHTLIEGLEFAVFTLKRQILKNRMSRIDD